ncbi:MAG: ABC transporter ATP-binding protein [bacterium]
MPAAATLPASGFEVLAGPRYLMRRMAARHLEHQVLLFDEPLSNLDVGLRVGLRREIRRMQQRLGITTVYVTHDQEEAMAISDRIAVMNQGLVEQIGTPREIYTRPITQFVAHFIGNTVVVDSEVVGRSGPDILVRLGDGVVPVREREAVAIGDRLWVAVRPEDLVLSQPGRDAREDLAGARMAPEIAGVAPLPGTLRHLEDLGNELHGELSIRGLPVGLRARLPASGEAAGLHVNDPVNVRLNPVTVKYGRGVAVGPPPR